eukprot:2594303-Rhodomonas_salina.4
MSGTDMTYALQRDSGPYGLSASVVVQWAIAAVVLRVVCEVVSPTRYRAPRCPVLTARMLLPGCVLVHHGALRRFSTACRYLLRHLLYCFALFGTA